MFGKKKNSQDLDPPPLARETPDAVEILRVWAAPGSPQQLTLRTVWKDPGAWGAPGPLPPPCGEALGSEACRYTLGKRIGVQPGNGCTPG